MPKTACDIDIESVIATMADIGGAVTSAVVAQRLGVDRKAVRDIMTTMVREGIATRAGRGYRLLKLSANTPTHSSSVHRSGSLGTHREGTAANALKHPNWDVLQPTWPAPTIGRTRQQVDDPELKVRVLEKLNTILDPEIGGVLISIRDDLRRLKTIKPATGGA